MTTDITDDETSRADAIDIDATTVRPRRAAKDSESANGSDIGPAINAVRPYRKTIDHIRQTSTGQRLTWLVLGLGLVTFVYGATTIRSAPVTEWGLLATASPAYALSLLLAAAGFAIAIRRANVKAAVVATILMIVVQRLPRSISTDYPMYAWTYKHLGVVDYIWGADVLARGVDVYNGWPGLFALTAWFSELTSVSPTSIAHWFTIFFHLGLAMMVYAAARAWGFVPLTALTATFLVATLNWVEQDYYSPQATTMLFTAGIFVLVGLSRNRPIGACLLIILFAAATVTHQLTPFWIFLMIGILVVSRKMKPWWIVIPLAAILVGFFLYNVDKANDYTWFSFSVTSNAKSNIATVGTVGQQVTALGVRFLTASMWMMTAVILLVRWRRKKPFWALGVLALSPLLLLGCSGYEGEVIYRVFLYSLIGCCFVIAPVLVTALQGRVACYLSGVVALLLATALAAQGYTGSWFANVVSKEQVDGYRELQQSRAEVPAYINAVAPVLPGRISWRYIAYARFNVKFDVDMIWATDQVGTNFDTDAEYDKFVKVVDARTDAPTYLVFTDQMQLYSWYFGILPLDALPNLENRVKKDPRWNVMYSEPGITVYVHRVFVE